MKLSCKLSLVNPHAILVLDWPGHESWWNSHANSRLSTLMQFLFSFDQDMRVDETLIQTLACQLSCNSCSRLTRTWELMKLSCKLSFVNPHAILVLVWPGHESWWNSHTNSRLSTLMQLLFSFDQDMRVDETLMQTLVCQPSCNSCSRLTRTSLLKKLSCKLSLAKSHATAVVLWPKTRMETLITKLFSIWPLNSPAKSGNSESFGFLVGKFPQWQKASFLLLILVRGILPILKVCKVTDKTEWKILIFWILTLDATKGTSHEQYYTLGIFIVSILVDHAFYNLRRSCYSCHIVTLKDSNSNSLIIHL